METAETWGPHGGHPYRGHLYGGQLYGGQLSSSSQPSSHAGPSCHLPQSPHPRLSPPSVCWAVHIYHPEATRVKESALMWSRETGVQTSALPPAPSQRVSRPQRLNFFHCTWNCSVWCLLSLWARKPSSWRKDLVHPVLSTHSSGHSFLYTITLLGSKNREMCGKHWGTWEELQAAFFLSDTHIVEKALDLSPQSIYQRGTKHGPAHWPCLQRLWNQCQESLLWNGIPKLRSAVRAPC